jgi:hypothetical protein
MKRSREREKPYSFFNPVLIDSYLIAVGCQVKNGDKMAHVVAVFDYTGKELFRFGNTESVFEPDGFCYFHDASSHPNGYVVVDSKCRKHSFGVKTASSLAGLNPRTPWVSTIPRCRVARRPWTAHST